MNGASSWSPTRRSTISAESTFRFLRKCHFWNNNMHNDWESEHNIEGVMLAVLQTLRPLQTSHDVIANVKTKQSVDTKLLKATPTLAATHNLSLVPTNNRIWTVINV